MSLMQGSHGDAARGEDHVGRQRDQLGPRTCECARDRFRPSGCRSVRCGARPSSTPAGLPGMPRGVPALPDRPPQRVSSTPMRLIRSLCCACAPIGHAAAPPSSVMNCAGSSFDHLVGAGEQRRRARRARAPWRSSRLMTRSNLVGCSTGRSAGFAPRRILST